MSLADKERSKLSSSDEKKEALRSALEADVILQLNQLRADIAAVSGETTQSATPLNLGYGELVPLENSTEDTAAREKGFTHRIGFNATGVEGVAGIIRWPTLLLKGMNTSLGIAKRVGVRFDYVERDLGGLPLVYTSPITEFKGVTARLVPANRPGHTRVPSGRETFLIPNSGPARTQ